MSQCTLLVFSKHDVDQKKILKNFNKTYCYNPVFYMDIKMSSVIYSDIHHGDRLN